jgi:ABC-2 type transport system ATP-binding protein
MIEIKNLTKKFNKKTAVENASFKVRPGEIFSLIGPNGSGKTTIIKIIAGLLQPTDGTILVNNLDIIKEPIKTKAQIGYIPDEPSVWPAMTGEEFLHLTGALYGLEEAERTKTLPELLDIFNLSGIEKRYFEEYSRGNKQKITILAALLHKPKLLLIDEPIVGLDPVSAEIAKKQFVEFANNGGAIILVTHTLSVAEEIANQIGILKQGKLIATGSLDGLRQQANLAKDASLENIYKVLT